MVSFLSAQADMWVDDFTSQDFQDLSGLYNPAFALRSDLFRVLLILYSSILPKAGVPMVCLAHSEVFGSWHETA